MVDDKPLFSVVSAYYKNEDLTERFLNNLIDKLPRSAELILVNAGSTPITHPAISLRIDLAANVSFSNSMNAGINAAKGEYVVVIGNDVFPRDPLWLVNLLGIQRETGAWIVAPNNDNPGYQVYADRFLIEDYKTYAYLRMYPAICWLLPRSTIDAIGLFDEQFIPGCYEDNDYVERVHRAGGRLAVAKEVMVGHELSQTLKLLGLNEAMRVNYDRFIRKWAR